MYQVENLGEEGLNGGETEMEEDIRVSSLVHGQDPEAVTPWVSDEAVQRMAWNYDCNHHILE